MDLKRLKDMIQERGKTYADCSKAIGRSMSYFSSRMRMNGKANFSLDEMEELGNYLNMYDYEKQEIFLDVKFTQEERSEMRIRECRNKIIAEINDMENIVVLDTILSMVTRLHREEQEKRQRQVAE